MKSPADATTADKLKLMSLKKEVMASVLSAGVRVNDATLRRKDDDKVEKLLGRVKAKSGESEPAAAEDDGVRNELLN